MPSPEIALDDEPPSLPRLEGAVLELVSDARYRDRARAIVSEIEGQPPIEQAPHALSALAEHRVPAA